MHSLDKNKINVVLLEGIHEKAVLSFQKAGYKNVTLLNGALDDAALDEALKDAHLLGIRSRTQLTAQHLKKAPKLIAAGCFCIGTNQVNLNTARELGVPIFNAPFSNTRSVAELVIGESVMLMRGIAEKSAAIHHDGTWLKSAAGSFEVRGKTLGIIGYGHIGMQVATLAENIGLNVMYYDIQNKLSLGNATPMDSLNALLEKADIVTLHVPETDQTNNMISVDQLKTMKNGSVLINASRGTVVDIQALADSLKSGHIKGAAIDVFPQEPSSKNEKLHSPLRGLENTILTPHIGGSTKEAQENIALEVADKLIKFSDNGSTVGAVNFAEVSLPTHKDCHRILHIHENKPGILNAINDVFTSLKVNISAQYLQTKDNIGYVVTDIDNQDIKIGIKAFKSIPGTIKTRVLY
ncbi:MAG: D-3-phosphoglycerate dehydrogenase [Alphaproteobacteria bacterium]